MNTTTKKSNDAATIFEEGDEKVAVCDLERTTTPPTKWMREDQFDMAKAVFNIVSSIMGAGILGLPRAIADCGWYGVGVLIVVTSAQAYTGVLIGRLLKAYPGVTTYSDLGAVVAGGWGKFAVLASQMTQCVGVAILYLVLAGSNLNSMFDFWEGRSQLIFTGLVTLAVLPTAYFRTMREVALVSIAGVFASLLACFIVFGESIAYPLEEVRYTEPTISSLSSAVATMIFAYGTHALFPAIHSSMKRKSSFNMALFISFPFIMFFYLLVSIASFAAFGCFLDANVLNNLPKNTLYYFVTSAITLHVMVAFTLFMNPVFHMAEYLLKIGFKEPDFLPATTNSDEPINDFYSAIPVPFSSLHRIYSILLRTFLVGITFFLAILLPFFGDIMSFLGGSSITIMSVSIPLWLYTKLFWKTLWWPWRLMNIVLCLIGTCIGLYASVMAAINMVENATKFKLFEAAKVGVNVNGELCSD